MGVAGAGGCCCGKCCKPKDWVFNYPYYIQGTPNPWKSEGRPIDSTRFKLIDWSRNGHWGVIGNFPNGIVCVPGDVSFDITPKWIIGSAEKAMTVPEQLNIGIRVQIHGTVGNAYYVYVAIRPCGKSGGVGSIDHPYVDPGTRSYAREFQPGIGGIYYTMPPECDQMTTVLTDTVLLNVGRSKITITGQQTRWVGSNNYFSVTFQNLNQDNECK